MNTIKDTLIGLTPQQRKAVRTLICRVIVDYKKIINDYRRRIKDIIGDEEEELIYNDVYNDGGIQDETN